MFDKHGPGGLRSVVATSEPQNGGDEMNQENNQIVHVRMVAREEDSGFWPNLEFAMHTLRLSALAAGFRRSISTASETYSADIRQKCQPGFHTD
jgi:hypothetical protein